MGEDFLDLTLLKKKGIWDRAREIDRDRKLDTKNEGGTVDLTSGDVGKFSAKETRRVQDSDFLGNLAGAVGENTVLKQKDNISNFGESAFGNFFGVTETEKVESSEVEKNEIGVDFKSKFDSLTREMDLLTERLGKIELRLRDL
jgi:hypothetical protein